MKRGTITASLGAVALTAVTFAAATPASAGAITTTCDGGSGTGPEFQGFTYHEGQGTVFTSLAGWCGTLGLRVEYSHVGGNSWTSWKYDKGGEAVLADVGTPIKSRHTTQLGGDFYTQNG